MRVLVLGAGVVGTATAWYLAKAGHEVSVADRQPGAGLETSFANGGQISPCHAEPWAGPHVIAKLARWLGRRDAPLLFHFNRFDPDLWSWGLRFLTQCPASRWRVNVERTLRIALYSRACLQGLRAETGISYDQRTQGILHVYDNQADFEAGQRAARIMEQYGLDRRPVTAAQCLELEPALSLAPALTGGILTPGDESGDAHLFTQNLAKLAEQQGVHFRFNTRALGFQQNKGRIDGLVTDQGLLTADCYVLATASFSPALVRPLGLRLPVIPAKGYSITLDVPESGIAPTLSITDDARKMVFSRLGNRLRAAGTAEMAGHDPSIDGYRLELIKTHARRLFPQAGDYAKAQGWAGLRPVTPDSVPVLGATPFPNLFINTGHGTLGWTMACGSGRMLADLISGQKPDISLDGLGLERF